MHRILSILIFIFLALPSFANMASPYQAGTKVASPFINEHVEILSEHIRFFPASGLMDAQVTVNYVIYAHESGIKIPMLFYADRYESDFEVRLNGNVQKLKRLPDEYIYELQEPLNAFQYLGYDEEGKLINIKWSEEEEEAVYLGDLLFFEMDLDTGQHEIQVVYTTQSWSNKSGWATEYSFHYSLYPAKSWKAFGDLTIELDNSEAKVNWESNLGPSYSSNSNLLKWQYEDLPLDRIRFSYQQELSKPSNTLINISPLWLSILMILPLVILHFVFMSFYRKGHKTKRFSWVQIVGAMTLPLLWVILYMSSFDIIDWSIGEHASRRHGYTFMAIVFYPIILPVYYLITWYFDKRMK